MRDGSRTFFSILLLLLLINLFSLITNCAASTTDQPSFSPSVNYLIDCGSANSTRLKDGRTFKSDRETNSLLSTDEDIQISVDSINITIPPSLPSSSLPLYKSARVLRDQESAFTFYISKPGRLFVRLYFFPLPDPNFNLTSAVFNVQTDHVVLLHEFSVEKNDSLVFKEYLVNVHGSRFSLKFKPKKDSFAFINAIEVVSAPDNLISDSAIAVSSDFSPIEGFKGLLHCALQLSYRINVGGPTIAPESDTLSRTWETDGPYNIFPQGAKTVAVSNSTIKYPKNGATPLIAPPMVYATAEEMEDPRNAMQANFNLSWMVNVEKSYSYFIRMHFCDIVSTSLNQLYFDVYINGIKALNYLDLSSETEALATAFYKDFELSASSITNGSIWVQVGPTNVQHGTTNAILNGIEVMKMSNSADSLDGFFNVDGKYKGPSSASTAMKIAASIGLGLALTAMVLLIVVCMRWKRRPQDWQKHGTFSSWVLPLRSPCKTRMFSCKTRSQSSTNRLSSAHKSKNAHSLHLHSPRGPGRFFHFSELQQATLNFGDERIIGVGGFGNVYLGTLEDGTKVAVKRGNGSTEQGINEFRTELNMLSNLRHRHLVSLMGFCDENQEMVLVYEYMANGSFRSHLYGSIIFPLLPWQKRLEICISAARGLHYLHTGATQSIVHRDVKTTNILLDENYVAKVSDFGLSKAVPDEAQVSTAVKGSFGYLDPEYYRSQQLTQKSDVYSFGVVLVEVLCARPVVCPALPREQANLADWVMQQHRRDMIHEIIDPRIVDTISPQCLKTFMFIAEKCLEDHGVDRPSMGDVLWHLENALKLQNDENAITIDQIEDHTASHRSDASDSINGNLSSVFSQIGNLSGR